jgi:ABC-type multidrug transport system fused ATPase/permease subunit
MSVEPPSNSPSDTADQNRKVIDEYRSIAKWVVSSFGAVAGALVVGVQLSSLGELKGSNLLWAAISLTVLFLAILTVIASAARVLLPVRLTYKGLATGRKFNPLRRAMVEEEDRELKDVTEELAEDVAKFDLVINRAQQARDALKREKTPRNEDAVNKAEQLIARWEPRINEKVWRGRTTYTEYVFTYSMFTIIVGLVAAAIAASGFAYVSSSATKPTPATKIAVSFSESKVKAPSPATNVHVSVNEPKTCVDLYLALDELVRAKPNIGSHWPTTSLGKQDYACGFHNEKELAHFLSFLAQR